MENNLQSRILGLDIIRSFAILFVICGHFFTIHTPFYSSSFTGVSMFIQAILKTFFCISVPLFIMITGYLNSQKGISKKYFKGGIRVITSYLLFSVIVIFFRKYYLNESLSWLQWIHKILDFSAIPYGWYIEMWIGLFLLTPFLNILYRNIPTRNQKLLFIGILFVLTIMPDMFNRYGFYIIPAFWQKCYPLLYFFIGLYIREYRPTVKASIAWCIILAICLINPLFSLAVGLNHETVLIQIVRNPFGVLGTIIACLFFLITYQIDIKTPSVRSIITKVSLLSLDMYLCCYIFDALVYPYFIEHFYINQSQFGVYFFIITPIIFSASFALAWMTESIKSKLHNIYNQAKN